MEQGYDILWFVAVVIGTAVLGLLIAYGMMRNRARTRAERLETERATRELYERQDPGYRH